MQIKIRKYVYRIYRPVVGAWLSGTKRELLSKVDDLQGLVEEMIKKETKEIGWAAATSGFGSTTQSSKPLWR
jgi:hypothetical protein